MSDTILMDIDLAKDIKDIISYGNVLFDSPALKDKILAADNDTFLRITKKIGSDTTILNVDIVDDDFLAKILDN